MRLHKRTAVWVTGSDGTSQMTLEGVFSALKGGSKWDDLEIVTERAESKELEQKRLAMKRMTELMRNMSPAQVSKAVDAIQAREDLMNLEDGYQ